MSERSAEIEVLMREAVSSAADSDVDAIRTHTSREPGAVSIGSDPNEWAEGHEQILHLFRGSSPEGELLVKLTIDDITGFREGTVGWGAGHAWFEVEGKRIPVRLTAVAHQEDGEWKLVQSHASIGVPNDRMTDPMFQG